MGGEENSFYKHLFLGKVVTAGDPNELYKKIKRVGQG